MATARRSRSPTRCPSGRSRSRATSTACSPRSWSASRPTASSSICCTASMPRTGSASSSTASSPPPRRLSLTAASPTSASPSPTSSRSTTTPTCSATCRVSACSTPGLTKRSAPTSAQPAGSAKTSVPRASPSAAGWRRRRRFWPAKAGGATLDARGSAGVCSREGVRPPAGGGWVNLRILFVEDSADDAELMLRRLREAGIEPHWDRVQTEAALREALVGERWDLALVDYNLPGFGGPQALAVLAAVATITAGAVDYVLKDNLTRLAPAVRRAVEGAELRRQRLRVREQARRTQFAIDHSSQAIVYVSEGGVILYLNAAAQRLGGVPPAEAVGQKIWSWLPLIDEKDSAALWAAAVQHSPVQFETMMSTVAGQERPVAVTLEYPGRPSDAFVVVYARDLTEQRQAEERATESEALYRRIVEMAGEGILAMDGEYRTTLVNPQMAAMLGYETEEMLGRVVSDFIFDEDLDDYAAEMKARAAGMPGTYERRFRRKDGGEVWASVSSTADLGPDGEFLGSFGMFTDITEMRAAEEALRQSEEQFRRFAEYLPGRMTIKDAELRYVFGNDERAAELSLPSARWIGKTPEELAIRPQVGGRGHRGPDLAAVLAPEATLVRAGHPRCASLHFSRVVVEVLVEYEIADHAPEHLFGLVPEHRRHLRVHERRAVLAVHRQDALAGHLDDAAVERLALRGPLFGLTLLGEVAGIHDDEGVARTARVLEGDSDGAFLAGDRAHHGLELDGGMLDGGCPQCG